VAGDRSDARRLHAIRVSEEAGNTRSWIYAVVDRYVSRRRGGVADDELRIDRTTLLDGSDALRAAKCSRLGRLWAGQELDAAFGVLLRDVFTTVAPDPAEVFALAESSKARMLLDSLAGCWVQPAGDLAAELAAAEREAMAYGEDRQDGLVWDEMRLGSELALGRSSAALDDLERRYRDAGAGFSGVAPVPHLDEIRNDLTPGELLIEYVVPHHQMHPAYAVWALAITAESVRLVPLLTDPVSGSTGFIGRVITGHRAPFDFSPLGGAIVTLRSAIQEDDDDTRADAALRSLHELLIAPLEAAGIELDGRRQVTVVPQRALHPVPFAALIDETGRRLLDRAPVAVAPSASAWSVLRRRRRPLRRHFLAFANPTLDPDLEPLPAAEREADVVAGRLSRAGLTVDVRARAQATETALAEHATEAGILYFATHGSHPDGAAIDLHGIHLAPTNDDDGVITAHEIRKLDLSGTWTAVLSVCDGGLYRYGPGDEPLGLVPALLVAGAANVVSTLWQLDDTAGRDLMVEMMDHLMEHGPAAALRTAAVSYSEAGDVAVRDWAAFVVVGSGGPPT
jgi:CHAT domain-containing protein